MPIDAAIFSALGIQNFAIPANVRRLEPYNGSPADLARIRTLFIDIQTVNNTTLDYYRDPSGQEYFIPHSVATPSYIDIGPAGAQTRYYVRAHIANGSYGSICKVSTSSSPTAGEIIRVLKLQKISYDLPHDEAYSPSGGYDWNRFIEIVKEAVINKCLVSTNPDNYNIIYKIGKALLSDYRSIRIYYLLESLDRTFQTAVQGLGDPGFYGGGGVYTPIDTQIGGVIRDTLCSVNNILYSLHNFYSGTHGDLHTKNVMFYTNAVTGEERPKLIDFGFTRLEYEGVLLECNTTFNNRSSSSRDLTILIFNIWHYAFGWRCSINAELQDFLTFANPDVGTFSTFQNWSTRNLIRGEPNFTMTVRPASNTARRGAIGATPGIAPGGNDYYRRKTISAVTLQDVVIPFNSLGPLYKYFNVFDNPSATHATVNAALACPGPVDAAAPGEGGSRRKRDRAIKRKVRYTRKNAKKHRVPHKRHGKGQQGRRTRRASSSLR